MKDNVMKINDGKIEVYTHEILRIADEYIAGLDNEEDIKNTATFSGMIQTINAELFRHTARNHDEYIKNAYQNTQNGILDLSDIQTLDGLFDIYCHLCFKYGSTPTLLEFGYMTSIDKDTISSWITGKSRNGNSDLHMRTSKRWKAVCEMALEKRAVLTNSIGSIFALKAGFSWRETAPVALEEQITPRHDTAEQIAERHRGAMLPEKPQL